MKGGAARAKGHPSATSNTLSSGAFRRYCTPCGGLMPTIVESRIATDPAELFERNRPLALFIARSFTADGDRFAGLAARGIDRDDLVQTALLALWRAAR